LRISLRFLLRAGVRHGQPWFDALRTIRPGCGGFFHAFWSHFRTVTLGLSETLVNTLIEGQFFFFPAEIFPVRQTQQVQSACGRGIQLRDADVHSCLRRNCVALKLTNRCAARDGDAPLADSKNLGHVLLRFLVRNPEIPKREFLSYQFGGPRFDFLPAFWTESLNFIFESVPITISSFFFGPRGDGPIRVSANER